MKKTYIALLATLMIGVSPLAVQAETIQDAVAAALQSHPSVEAAQARVDASTQDESEQFSGYFPELNVGAKGGRIFGDNSTTRGLVVTRGEAYSGYGEGSVTLKQPLLGIWQTSKKVGAAQARVLSADQSAMDTREKLALFTAKAYIELARNIEVRAHLKKSLKETQSLVNRIASAVKDGGLEETDLQRANDLVFTMQRVIANTEAGMANAHSQYVEYTGKQPDETMTKPQPAMNLAPIKVEDAIRYAQKNSAAYKASLLSADAARDDYEAERLELVPDIDTEFSYLKSDQKDDIGGETIDARAIVRLNWDFSLGGAHLARIKKKRFEHAEAQANAADYHKQLERMVRVSYTNYATQLELQKVARQREALSKKIYKNSKVQFDGARISLLDLLRAHNERTNVQMETMNAKYDLLATQYDLLASVGLLRESMGLASASETQALLKVSHEQKQ